MSATGAAAPRRPVRESIELLRAHQKPQRGVSVYSIYVNRPAGRVLAAVASSVGATPNQVTLLSGLLSMTAIVLLAVLPIGVEVGVVAALLLAVGFALDSADGQLARLRGGGSRSGELLDHAVDLLVKLSLHLAVLIAWWRSGVTGPLLAVPIAFQLVAVMLFFLGTMAGVLGARRDPAAGASLTLRSWALLPVDHGVISLSFLVWGFVLVYQVVYVVLFAIALVALVALGARWFRELS